MNLDDNLMTILIVGGATLCTIDISGRAGAPVAPACAFYDAGDTGVFNFGQESMGAPLAGYIDGVF